MPDIDPFQREKDIRAGKLDDEMPGYEELTGWLQRIPKTWLPGLLANVTHQCVVQNIFQDGKLLPFVERAELQAKHFPESVLRDA